MLQMIHHNNIKIVVLVVLVVIGVVWRYHLGDKVWSIEKVIMLLTINMGYK